MYVILTKFQILQENMLKLQGRYFNYRVKIVEKILMNCVAWNFGTTITEVFLSEECPNTALGIKSYPLTSSDLFCYLSQYE